MRKFLLASASLLALVTTASAADMATKAPPIGVPFTSGSGFYWGLGTYAGVAATDMNGTGLLVTNLVSNNVSASGAGVDGALGYINGNTALVGFGNWYRFQGTVSYQNIQGAVGGNSVVSRWAATQEYDVNADILAFITSAVGSGINWPTLTPPALPANIQVGIPKQYIGVVAREFGETGQVGAAHGVNVGIAPGVTTGFLYPTLGKDGRPNGGAIDLWASVTWATRGATLGNVFAANGAPLTTSAGAEMGTTYLTGITVLRGF